MSSSSSNSSEGEVILISPSPSKKKQVSPAKRWCFTYNNYPDDDVSSIVPLFDEFCDKAFFSKEVGESGTPHLQGYFEFKKKMRPMSVFKDYPKIHFELAKGNLKSNFDYCSKSANFHYSKGVPKPVKVIQLQDMYDWELEILNIIKTEPDDRTIYWFHGPGGKGKTSFCKYLTVKHNAICLSGKSADVRNGIIEYVKTNGSTPELVLMNIPKSFDTHYLSYEAIENIKDMYFYSGKYEGGMVCGNPPHLFIFSNEEPCYDKLSPDRWKIREIV